MTQRSTADGNLLYTDQAIQFAQIFFSKHDKEKDTLSAMYHDQSTLIWNGNMHKTRASIAKFYHNQQPTQIVVKALDAQIMPQMGDIVDMGTIVACGKFIQNEHESNFSRTFLLGRNSPGSADYLIVSDTMRITN